MRRRIFWAVIPLALIIIGAGAASSVPMTRHMISGLWNMPDRLPALSTNSQVHYQRGAEDFAHDVAALYPDAIARVEVVHGRRFAHRVSCSPLQNLKASLPLPTPIPASQLVHAAAVA